MSPPEHLDLGLVGEAEQLQRFIGTAGAGPDQPGRPVVIGPDREGVAAARPEREQPVAGRGGPGPPSGRAVVRVDQHDAAPDAVEGTSREFTGRRPAWAPLMRTVSGVITCPDLE
jgi:hypothetical protein